MKCCSLQYTHNSRKGRKCCSEEDNLASAQVHELPWGHWQIGNDQEGTLSVFFTTDIIHRVSYQIYNKQQIIN